jgi:hypothetical protein
VPVGLAGPRRCLAKKSYLLRPGRVRVQFGEPIPTLGLGVTAKSALMERVRVAMEALRGNTNATETVATLEGRKEA